MIVKNCEKLVDMFHKAIRTTTPDAQVPFAELNQKATLCGYVIHPDCCNTMVEKWLDILAVDHNSTFYKEWGDVISKNRFGLFVDQILHYATTYGTNFSVGNGYVPNDGSSVPDFKSLKLVEPVSVEEMFKMCLELVSSGIALKHDTIDTTCNFISSVLKSAEYGIGSGSDLSIDIDKIKCKEAQAKLCVDLGIFPKDEISLLRCLVYVHTKNPMIIKNRSEFENIRSGAASLGKNSPLLILGPDQKEALSRIFLRFKPIFLAMKTMFTANVVNEISRLSKKNHVPMKPGFWETLISVPRPLQEVEMRLRDLDVFRKLRLLQSTRIALRSLEKDKFYLVRNGKGFLRKNYSPKYDRAYLEKLEVKLYMSLIGSLSKKACRVRLPKYFELAVPTSEKSFLGNLPFGTEIELSRNSIVGIYWRNEWSAFDIDLSMIDFAGNRISWCDDYYNGDGSVIYSGDMTNADPEASELLYISGDRAPDGIVQANLFSGDGALAKFRFFVATEQLDPDDMMNYMVDHNKIRLDTTVEFGGRGHAVLGIVRNGRLVLTSFSAGNSRVARPNENSLRTIEVLGIRADLSLKLREVLENSGFTVVSDGEDCDVDLSDPTKDAIINLLKD